MQSILHSTYKIRILNKFCSNKKIEKTTLRKWLKLKVSKNKSNKTTKWIKDIHKNTVVKVCALKNKLCKMYSGCEKRYYKSANFVEKAIK